MAPWMRRGGNSAPWPRHWTHRDRDPDPSRHGADEIGLSEEAQQAAAPAEPRSAPAASSPASARPDAAMAGEERAQVAEMASESSAPLNRDEMIALAAYLRAEARGFEGGNPVEDWLAAEAEVDARLREGARA